MDRFYGKGNLIFYCCSSDDPCLIHQNTHLNSSFMDPSPTLTPSCSGNWILFVISESVGCFFFSPSAGHWSQAWSLAALWHSTLISIGGTTSIRTGTEQESVKPMPYPCWRANWLENKHGSIVGVFLFINMFRWSLVNCHWDAFYCWFHPSTSETKRAFNASRDWKQVQNTM